MVAWKRLPQLLQGPLRSWLGGHILVENSSCSQFHDHEYVKSAKSRRDHNEEITCHDHLGMVMDEGQPALFGIGCAHRAGVQVLPYSTRRYSNSEFEFQLVGDALLAPNRILRPSPGSVAGGPWANEVFPLVWTSSAKTTEILGAAIGSACPASHSPANCPTGTFGLGWPSSIGRSRRPVVV